MKRLLLLVLVACGDGGSSPPDPPQCEGARTIFLNRGGGDYTAGPDDSSANVSSILEMNLTFGAPVVDDADWTTFLACVTDKFAPFNVVITDQDPTVQDHVELVVLDSPQEIGLQSGVGSVSPFTCNVVEQAVAYVFWAELAENGVRCQVAAQTLGSAYGLDHVMACPDIMTFQNGCGAAEDKTFTDVDAECGEIMARNCQCRTVASQNSFQYLTDTLGPACEL